MQYLFTERAHLMCPGMAFGITIGVRAPLDEKRVLEAFSALAQAHPFLKARLGCEPENNAFFYDVTDTPQTRIEFGCGEVPAVDSVQVMEAFEQRTQTDWDLFGEGMLKAVVWKMGNGTCFLLVFHHLLADGRGALGLAQELADRYAAGKQPQCAPEKLIASAAGFPAGSGLPFLSRILVDRANREWRKENRQPLSWNTYHEFADRFLKEHPVRHTARTTGAAELTGILRECHEHAVTVNDLLTARMLLEENTNRIVVACDLRDRIASWVPGALGNCSTAFSVTVRKKSQDACGLANEVHRSVQKVMGKPSRLYLVLRCYAALDPGVLDAAFLSARGAYDSKAAAFVGKVFFGFGAAEGYSLTNLGRIESDSIGTACFIPPASPAIRKTKGVLTVNGVMTVCTSERGPDEA